MTRGILELGLVSSEGIPAADDNVEVRFKRDGKSVDPVRGLAFPPIHHFELAAFPEVAVWTFEILPSRFRPRNCGAFALTNGETVRRRITVLRRPDKWAARFTPWASLGVDFEKLKALLDASSRVALIDGGKPLGSFSGRRYDDAGTKPLILAKATLLNLAAKLSRETAPGGAPWFDGIQEVLGVGRERMLALVSARIANDVERLAATQPDGYRASPAKNHRKNIPAGYTIERITSVKTDERKGNLQLTVARVRDAKGKARVVADIDIDENGRFVSHMLDVFKHKHTGGTHPFDVHECLQLCYGLFDSGYRLV